jgi:hypothetical protein
LGGPIASAAEPFWIGSSPVPPSLTVGQRFSNEGTPYNLFAKAMIAANALRSPIPTDLIAR